MVALHCEEHVIVKAEFPKGRFTHATFCAICVALFNAIFVALELVTKIANVNYWLFLCEKLEEISQLNRNEITASPHLQQKLHW